MQQFLANYELLTIQIQNLLKIVAFLFIFEKDNIHVFKRMLVHLVYILVQDIDYVGFTCFYIISEIWSIGYKLKLSIVLK